MNAKEDSPMTVKVEAMSRALKLLVASGCQFAVIDASGAKHGALEVVDKTAKKKPRNHPRGSYLDYHRPMTQSLQAGESVTVPFGQFSSAEDRESLRSSISAQCSRDWGNGSYITAMAAGGIELLRVE